VRGTVTRVVVQSKVGGAPAYEIQVAPPGRESMSDRGNEQPSDHAPVVVNLAWPQPDGDADNDDWV
jgi:hypothetical protein